MICFFNSLKLTDSRIHEYNTTCLVLTLLPFHTRPVFKLLLSIVPRTLNPTLAFLRPYVESEGPPPRHAVVYAATHNDSFFAAWSKHVVDSCRTGHSSSAAICYWATGAAEAITARLDQAMAGHREVQNEKEGNLLRNILPVLSDGLVMREVSELRTACFTIVSVLVARIELESRASTAFMEAIVRGQAGNPKLTDLVCLALIARSSKLPRLPQSVFEAVTARQTVNDVAFVLGKVNQRCQIGDLALGVLKGYKDRLKDDKTGDCSSFLRAAIDTDLLDPSQLATALRTLFEPQKGGEKERVESELRLFLSQMNPSASTKLKLEKALEICHFSTDVSSKNSPRLLEPADSSGEERQDLSRLPGVEQPTLLELSEMTASASGKSYVSLLAAPPAFFQALASCIFAKEDSSYALEEFAALEVFAMKDVQLELPFVTFFLRVLVSKFASHHKVAALGNLGQFLHRADMSFDVQHVIPYVLCALCDPAFQVRDAASDFVIGLSEYYSGLEKRVEHTGDVEILGEVDIHRSIGDDSTTSWLGIKDVRTFLSVALLPSLEDFRQDMSHLPKALGLALSKSKHGDERQRLKKSTRARLLSLLYRSILFSPSCIASLRLLRMVNMVQEGKAQSKSQQLMPLFKELEKLNDSELQKTCVRDGIHHDDLLSELANTITPKDKHGLLTLQNLIAPDDSSRNTLLRMAGVRRVSQLWPSLNEETRLSFAICLYETATESIAANSGYQNAVISALRELDLSAQILATLLDKAPKLMSNEGSQPSATKKRKTNDGLAKHSLENDAAQNLSFLKLTMLIELVDSAKAPRGSILLPQLFRILEDLQQSKHQRGLDSAYLQSILLDCLRTEIDRLKYSPKNAVGDEWQTSQVDLVVDCLRTSGTHVQNSALTLLSSMARVTPGTIMHSVMPIFTLMGSTTLAQSDENSVHVVTQTMSSVIPPLISEFERRKEGPWTGVSELATGFVAAMDHIPAAKRFRVFSVLVDTIGSERFMFILVFLALTKHAGGEAVAELLKNLIINQDSTSQVTVSIPQSTLCNTNICGRLLSNASKRWTKPFRETS